MERKTMGTQAGVADHDPGRSVLGVIGGLRTVSV